MRWSAGPFATRARAKLEALLVSVSEVAGIPRQEALLESAGSPAHRVRAGSESGDDLHDPASPLHDAQCGQGDTNTSSEYSPPLRTWDELHEPMGEPGDKTPPPSPKTPVFSPLPYSPLSSAEVERMIKRSKTGEKQMCTPSISPLPYTPLTSVEVQRMVAKSRPKRGAAKRLFPQPTAPPQPLSTPPSTRAPAVPVGCVPASAASTVDSLIGASTQGCMEARIWDAGCDRATDATPSCCMFASALNPVP